MMNFLKLAAIVILAIIGVNIALGFIGSLLGVVMKIAVTAVLLGGIVYLIYTIAGGKKSLGGSRSILP